MVVVLMSMGLVLFMQADVKVRLAHDSFVTYHKLRHPLISSTALSP